MSDELFEGTAVKVQEESTVPATVKQDMIPLNGVSSGDRLIEMVLSGGLGIEVLEKIIDLRTKEEERAAKREFDIHFAELQSKLGPVAKNKTAYNNGKAMYTYATLDELQAVCGPIIATAGFSYSWREENIESGGKRVVMTISGYGHSRENHFDVPFTSGTNIQNAIQAQGSMSSYGKRYTFASGFGLIIEGEDDDAQGFSIDEVLNNAPIIVPIRDAQNMAELGTAFRAAWASAKGDVGIQRIITSAKDARKKNLG